MPEELGDIGMRLRSERERFGISQREVARRIGLSASLISQIEKGQSKPSVGTLYAIVTELGCPLDRVFLGAQQDERGPHGDARRPMGSPGARTPDASSSWRRGFVGNG